MDRGRRRMNCVALTIINPRKEYWPSRGSNQRPSVLKSGTLPTELWGSTLLIKGLKRNSLSNPQKVKQTQERLQFESLYCFNRFLHIYSFEHMEEKSFRKTLWKKMKLLKMSNFILFQNVFYAICFLKSFNSHISFVVCSFFEFGTVSKWCIRNGLIV